MESVHMVEVQGLPRSNAHITSIACPYALNRKLDSVCTRASIATTRLRKHHERDIPLSYSGVYVTQKFFAMVALHILRFRALQIATEAWQNHVSGHAKDRIRSQVGMRGRIPRGEYEIGEPRSQASPRPFVDGAC
jgi:hypothetical protein